MHFPCANGSCVETGHCCFPKAAVSTAGAKVTSTRKRHLKMSVKWNISHLLTLGPSPWGTETWCRTGSLGKSHLPAAFPGRAQGIKVSEELQEARHFPQCLPSPSLMGPAKPGKGLVQNPSKVAWEATLNPVCFLCWDKAVIIWKWPNGFLSRFVSNKVISLLTDRF